MTDKLPKPNYESKLQRHASQSRSVHITHSHSTKTTPTNHKSHHNYGIVQSVLDQGRKYKNSSPDREIHHHHGKKKSPQKKQPPGITPKLNSSKSKFVAAEILSKKNLMRPTSSRVGYFLPEKQHMDMSNEQSNIGSYLPILERPSNND